MDRISISIPEEAAWILARLQEAGYEAYIVGGCVRDSLLGRVPDDWDITTSAKPEQVKALFRRTVDTGILHGTVTVLAGLKSYEVTTYRLDGAYEDGRHPVGVSFTGSLTEDLRRRDFTINAMAYNNEAGLVDEFDGLGDLKRGIIRCVGSPKERFGEDALRMMRAVRFSAQLDFGIEQETLQAVREQSASLDRISRERIQTELNKLLLSDHPARFRLFCETGLTKVILPEFDCLMELPQHNPYHCYTVGEHTLRAVEAAPCRLSLRLTMLLHDIGKPSCRQTDEKGIDHFRGHQTAGAELADRMLRALRFDNRTRIEVTSLIALHDNKLSLEESAIRKQLHNMGPDRFFRLLEVKRADKLGQNPEKTGPVLAELPLLRTKAEAILAAGQCLTLRDLAVNGRDVLAAGMEPGRAVGEILDGLLERVLSGEVPNERAALLALLPKE